MTVKVKFVFGIAEKKAKWKFLRALSFGDDKNVYNVDFMESVNKQLLCDANK